MSEDETPIDLESESSILFGDLCKLIVEIAALTLGAKVSEDE